MLGYLRGAVHKLMIALGLCFSVCVEVFVVKKETTDVLFT